MLEGLRRTLCVWIDRQETVLVLREGLLRPKARLLGRYPNADTATSGLRLDGLRHGLEHAQLSGIAAQIVVQDDAMRIWPVDVPSNASRRADLDAACAMRFEAIFDEQLHPWVWRSSPQVDSGFIACAMQRSQLDELQATLQNHRLELVSLEARSIALWNHWQKNLNGLSAHAWLGICTLEQFTICLAHRGRVMQVRHVPLSEAQRADPLWLNQHVQREASRFNQEAPELIGLCGMVVDSWVRASVKGLRVQELSRLSLTSNLFGAMT
jgi:hypothetical protein